MQCVPMVLSGWKEVTTPFRVVWRPATLENGGQCVQKSGMIWTPEWSVDNLEKLKTLVSKLMALESNDIIMLLYRYRPIQTI